MNEVINMKTLKLAFLGFGNCGQALAKLLSEKHDEIASKYNVDVKVIAIATASKGNLVYDGGIDLKHVLDDLSKNGKFTDGKMISNMSTMDIVDKADYDAICEMTPLNIMTGEPAATHLRHAIARKKHVITANKGPIAWYYDEIKKLAKDAGVGFFYETVVMDGTPVFNLTEHTLKMAKVTEITGILNSTTNFILEEMAKGCDYDDIIRRGRERGFIEADSAMDIEGYDAAAKITALLNVLMDAKITPDKVDRKGIEDITEKDIEEARERGNLIKLLCRGYIDENGEVHAEVKPKEVPFGDMLATITSTDSVVSITTDLMGKISVIEHAPEIEQTAYGVFGDILRVIEITEEG